MTVEINIGKETADEICVMINFPLNSFTHKTQDQIHKVWETKLNKTMLFQQFQILSCMNQYVIPPYTSQLLVYIINFTCFCKVLPFKANITKMN